MDVVDLDALVGTPRPVKLGGAEYLLPHDCPVELYLLLLRVAQAGDEDPEVELVEALTDGILELFQVHQPDMERLPAAMSLQVAIQLVGTVYGEAAAAQDRPTPAKRPKAGTTSTPRRRKPSRSSSS